jgi:hypothetical protein
MTTAPWRWRTSAELDLKNQIKQMVISNNLNVKEAVRYSPNGLVR